MDISVQTAVDNLIGSREQNWPSSKYVATLLAWAEVDGWDDCVKAWEAAGEPVVVDWNLLCEEFANDQSVEEYADLEPEGLTDDDRLAHLQARLSDSLQDPDDGRSWSVHPMQVIHTNGTAAVFCLLVQNRGQAGPELKWFGLFPSVDASMVALEASGYHRCDAPLSHDAARTAWRR